MLTNERAHEILRAWLKRRKYDNRPDHHAFETECFLEGLRACAGEWLKAEKNRKQEEGRNNPYEFQNTNDDNPFL